MNSSIMQGEGSCIFQIWKDWVHEYSNYVGGRHTILS